MTKIESEQVTVLAPRADVFLFLSDMNNIKLLLPADRISDWKSDTDSCSFKVQNAYTISLNKSNVHPDESIRWVSGKGSPFEFDLVAMLTPSDTDTMGKLVCQAKLNPFIELMVKSPLKNLFDYMARELTKQFKPS